LADLIPFITQEVGTDVALLMYGSRTTADNHKLLSDLLGSIGHHIVIAESQSRPASGLTSGVPAFGACLLELMAEEAARSNPDFPLGWLSAWYRKPPPPHCGLRWKLT
jgi:pyrroline-5-carboxylate reductase